MHFVILKLMKIDKQDCFVMLKIMPFNNKMEKIIKLAQRITS